MGQRKAVATLTAGPGTYRVTTLTTVEVSPLTSSPYLISLQSGTVNTHKLINITGVEIKQPLGKGEKSTISLSERTRY